MAFASRRKEGFCGPLMTACLGFLLLFLMGIAAEPPAGVAADSAPGPRGAEAAFGHLGAFAMGGVP